MAHPVLSSLALLACLSAPCAQQAAAQPRFDFDATPGNLAKSVVPSRYALSLDLDPARDGYTGRADIVIDVRQQVRAVVLHARDLIASRTELLHDGQARTLQITPGPVRQSWALEPADALPIAPGRYTVRIDYSGRVNRSGAGLFRADFVAAGKPQRMLTTQLESIGARNVFPSFDEPARAARLIEDQQRKAGPDGAAPAARIASRIALLAPVRQRDAEAFQALLARW